MSQNKDSLEAMVEQLKRKAPELLDILSAKTEDEFDSAFSAILERAVFHLEKNKKNFNKLDEEGLTAVLAGSIMSVGLTVTQETNSNGHVDLTILADHSSPVITKLGEAKIYKGFDYHISGLQQLIGRYSVGREGSGLLIEYFRKKNISGLVSKIRKRMDKDLPLNQINKSANHTLKWSFTTKHQHNSGEKLKVQHISCNLYDE